MRIQILFASSGELLSALGPILVLGLVAVICLIAGIVVMMGKTEGGRRRATRYIIAAAICIITAVFAPLIAQILHLP